MQHTYHPCLIVQGGVFVASIHETCRVHTTSFLCTYNSRPHVYYDSDENSYRQAYLRNACERTHFWTPAVKAMRLQAKQNAPDRGCLSTDSPAALLQARPFSTSHHSVCGCVTSVQGRPCSTRRGGCSALLFGERLAVQHYCLVNLCSFGIARYGRSGRNV